MANEFYDNHRNNLLGNGTHTLPDMDTNNIRASLLDDTDHTTNLATDIDAADITDAAWVPGPATHPTGVLLGTTVVGGLGVGVFSCANTTFTTVTADQAEEIVVYQDSGTEGTSPLICNFDTATGLPVSPNGGDIIIVWNGSGMFQV